MLAGLIAMIVMTALIVGVVLVIAMMQPATGGAGWSFAHTPHRLPLVMIGALLISVAIAYTVFKRASKR